MKDLDSVLFTRLVAAAWELQFQAEKVRKLTLEAFKIAETYDERKPGQTCKDDEPFAMIDYARELFEVNTQNPTN